MRIITSLPPLTSLTPKKNKKEDERGRRREGRNRYLWPVGPTVVLGWGVVRNKWGGGRSLGTDKKNEGCPDRRGKEGKFSGRGTKKGNVKKGERIGAESRYFVKWVRDTSGKGRGTETVA